MTQFLAILPDRDSPTRPDWSGAFLPASRMWTDRHGGPMVPIDISRPKPDRFRQVLAAIELHQPEVIAFFCHGLALSLPQLGVTVTNVHVLSAAIAANATAPKVALFACLAGEDPIPGPDGPPGGDGGLADQMRDWLVRYGATGCWVDAHGSTSQWPTRARDAGGHTTKSPYLRRFAGPSIRPTTEVGGYWIVEPRSPLWRTWIVWLATGGWSRLPLMSQEEVHADLRARRP